MEVGDELLEDELLPAGGRRSRKHRWGGKGRVSIGWSEGKEAVENVERDVFSAPGVLAESVDGVDVLGDDSGRLVGQVGEEGLFRRKTVSLRSNSMKERECTRSMLGAPASIAAWTALPTCEERGEREVSRVEKEMKLREKRAYLLDGFGGAGGNRIGHG
jgi:hypothetical protein